MYTVTRASFRYEIALGAPFPIPEPKLDYYPHSQDNLQQFLHALCKKNIGSLGKKDGKWSFGEDCPDSVKLGSRQDLKQLFDFAEELNIIVAKPDAGGEGFIPYQLSESHWSKFDKFEA